MKPHQDIPSDTPKARYWTECFTLKPRKRKFVYENIKVRDNMYYWIWSSFKRAYYYRKLRPENDIQKLIEHISLGLVYLAPTEEEKALIRAEMESCGLGYYQMQRFRMYEYAIDKHERGGDKHYGYLQKLKELENKKDEVLNQNNKEK
jgi:hypothetical protein